MNTTGIGDFIREKRYLKGWTQEEFADRLNVSAKTVSTWENGNCSSIKLENLIKLKEVLQVSIIELLDGKELPNLDHETKMRLDEEIIKLNDRVDDVQCITIKVEDRGILSMEMGIYAFGLSIFAIALAWWSASTKTPLITFICLILGFFGLGFMALGKRVVYSLSKRILKERNQTEK